MRSKVCVHRVMAIVALSLRMCTERRNSVCVSLVEFGVHLRMIGFNPGHTAEIVSLHFNTEGDRIITGSFDHTARIWYFSEYGVVVRAS